MPSTEPLGRSGITSRAAVPNDVLTFWIRRGVLHSIEAANGPGKHLKFRWFEANIAGLMNQLRMVGVPVEGLVSIASIFRDAVHWATQWNLTTDDVNALWTLFNVQARRDRGDYPDDGQYEDALAVWRHPRHGSQRITPDLERLAESIGLAEFLKYRDAFLTIMDVPDLSGPRIQSAPDVSYFWLAGDRWQFMRGERGPEAARNDGALATIAVDVSTVLFDVWSRV